MISIRLGARVALAVAAVCVAASVGAAAAAAVPNTRPVIGVLAVPAVSGGCETVYGASAYDGQGSCFATVYPKWIEMAGGRVVPIPYDMPSAELEKMYSYLNGVLFTGGGLSLGFETTYFQTALHLYNMTLAANKAGEHVPLWGTCMGFQLLNLLTSLDPDVLTHNAFDSEDLPLPLDLTPEGAGSRLLSAAPADVFQWLTTENITVNLHHDGVTPASFKGNERLSSFYTMISTNKGRKGKEFVSTMEGKDYPVYGTQWHPERPEFEWTEDLNINHSAHAVRSMQFVGNFLISEARKNSRSFPSEDELGEALIYNYAPSLGASSYQDYVFPPNSP